MPIEGVTEMKSDTGFWFGMGAGMMAGVTLGLMMPMSHRPKTEVGKRIQKMGVAVDHTVDNIMSNLR